MIMCSRNDVIDFTPALHAQALENLKKYRWEQTPFVPPTMEGKEWIGAINIGNSGGRHQLAGRQLRSRDRHVLRAIEQLTGHYGRHQRCLSG